MISDVKPIIYIYIYIMVCPFGDRKVKLPKGRYIWVSKSTGSVDNATV